MITIVIAIVVAIASIIVAVVGLVALRVLSALSNSAVLKFHTIGFANVPALWAQEVSHKIHECGY